MDWIGKEVRRREDERLVTGRGTFADDLHFTDCAYAAFVRSPHAHAAIVSIDVEAARAADGVLAVLTAADLARENVVRIPHSVRATRAGADVYLANREGSERAESPHAPLAIDRVRFVGEPVAMVVAETMALAKDAAELVDVDYAELPAVVRALDALADDAPQLWEHIPGNVALEAEIGDRAGTDAAFAAAAHVVAFTSQVNRVTGVHMEPRTSAASYDAATGRYTVHCSGGMGVVAIRDQIAGALDTPPETVRVVAPPDVGGNFGTRNATYPEFVLLPFAAKRLGRPIKHQAERQEAFLSDYQARDLHVAAELALDVEGNFLALRCTNTSNIGAHVVSYTPLNKGIQLMTGLYRVPVAHAVARAVLTNTPPNIPYRSAGRPEAIYAIERLCDLAARQCGFDRVALRRRNMIPPDAFPYVNPFGIDYDNGEHVRAMDRVLAMADWDGFEARRAEARRRGRYRGIGLGNYIEGTGGTPRERAEVTVLADEGIVDVVIGTQNTGQGHETAFAQLVASYLGIDHEAVRIRASDTDFVHAGGGTHSGRSLRFSSIVMHNAVSDIVLRGRAILAHQIGVPIEQVGYADGAFRAEGSNRVMTLFEMAAAAEDPALPQALHGTLRAVSDEITRGLAFPYGAAVCEIEIDPETGAFEIVRYSAVDDVGRALNPMIIHGQTHGGIAQGVGQALFEQAYYDPDSGQNLAASFMDYAVPRASDLPHFATEISEVPSVRHPMGFRPGGEGGTTPALGATINAICDALHEFGVDHIEMPATAPRIWAAIQAARQRKAA